MAKIDAIDVPKLTWPEAAAPSTPASGKVVTYAKSDGLMYSKDDAGTETLMSGGSGGGGGLVEAQTVLLTGGADLTTSSTTFTDMTGVTVTLTTAAVRCLVNFSGVANNSNAGASVCVDVAIDGTRYANSTNGLVRMVGTSPTGLSFSFITAVLSAASHTIKIQWRASANTAGMAAQASTSPIMFQVIETTLTT